MTEYQVDLGKANFKFDLDLLEHISTDLPQISGGPSLFFDHQQSLATNGEQPLLQYPQVSACYWQPAGNPGLECVGEGLSVKFSDPGMDPTQAKEILFRLANICQWNPQNAPPTVETVVVNDVALPFDPDTQFRLPRESVMTELRPAGDWSKPDEIVFIHLGKPALLRLHSSKNEVWLEDALWHRMDEIKEIVFKRTDDRLEFALPEGRWSLMIGRDRPAQLLEARAKHWGHNHKLNISEAMPDGGRNQLLLKVDLLRAVLEGGQIRIRGQREVLFHHGQACIRIDGEIYAHYKDLTQLRLHMVQDRLQVRLWFKPNLLLMLEATSACDLNTGRIPDFLRALVRGLGVPVEE